MLTADQEDGDECHKMHLDVGVIFLFMSLKNNCTFLNTHIQYI